MPLTIAGQTFPTKQALTTYVRNILWTSAPGVPLFLDDEQVLRAILTYHPHSETKIGCGIRHITSERQGANDTRGFWITRLDGSRIDFSYKECLKPSTPSQAIQRACRAAIVGQILAKKTRMFGGREIYRCPVNDTPCRWQDVHVDHRPPLTFLRLVEDWLLAEHRQPSDILLQAMPDGLGKHLAEPFLSRWQVFHQDFADLWVISIAAHVTLTNQRRQSSSSSLSKKE